MTRGDQLRDAASRCARSSKLGGSMGLTPPKVAKNYAKTGEVKTS